MALEIPDWVEEDAAVCLPGGPPWIITKVLVTPTGAEVHVKPMGDDQSCAWALDLFVQVWGPTRLTRFDRDAPL